MQKSVDEPMTSRDQFLQSVSADPGFKHEIALIHEYSRRHPDRFERIAAIKLVIKQRWKLTDEEYTMLSIGQLIYLTPPRKGARLRFDPDNLAPTIELDLDASPSQVMAAYGQFNNMRRALGYKATKAKPIEYAYAVYAVFIGLRDGKSYSEIHAELTNAESPSYDERIARIFLTPNDLRLYYNKRKPQ